MLQRERKMSSHSCAVVLFVHVGIKGLDDCEPVRCPGTGIPNRRFGVPHMAGPIDMMVDNNILTRSMGGVPEKTSPRSMC